MPVRGRSGTQRGYDSIRQSQYILGKKTEFVVAQRLHNCSQKLMLNSDKFRRQLVALTPRSGDNLYIPGAGRVSAKLLHLKVLKILRELHVGRV
jgi:hypothetical protein